ncbi:(d)CMP kinase [Hydrogenovibrio sp. SC-1]|uniref:(d)CMP kinase n=1 Tax=Hydrogenovibrio sp. SC-1 TaxID=2065820 RepID=UPI000C7A7F3F|nr:(d)CMP kinase [Hydrogenovibrio sp. SC-1]PLA73663.1 (d)CMP kinase [Hydrogenovibrio sp. SC-1]
MNTDCIITIDGPSGVGKGTVAQYLCEQTGFHLLDSGAIYRSLAFGVQKQGLTIENLPGLVALAENLPVRFETGKAFYQDEDITLQIRTETVAATASKIASIPEVRAALLKRQKDFAQPPGLIADGRDMGTVVFPKAPVKLFLTATAEERAKRRLNQLKNQEVDVNIRKITQDIKERDERDRNRAASPLLPAADALTIDTTHLSISQVCEQAINEIRQKGLIE